MKRSDARWKVQLRVIRTQARRYRIMLHVLGWEDSQWNEMIQEMKRCPMTFRKRPEGMLASRDFYNEGMRGA